MALVGDRSTPLDVRVVIVVLVAWIVSPIDLIPEFIPVLGPFDDVVVAIVALRYVRRRLGSQALRDRWAGSPEGFDVLARVIGQLSGGGTIAACRTRSAPRRSGSTPTAAPAR